MEKTAIEKLNNLWTATTLNGRLRTGRNRNRKKNRNGNGYGTHNTNREPTWAGQRSHISWLNLILITLNLIIQKERKILPQKLTYLYVEIFIVATSCKNVETHPWKNDLWCCKLLVVSGLWDIILTSLLPPIQSCSSKFWVWSCIASNFDKGWRGDHKHKIMDRLFMPKYGTVSQVLLQLVVASIRRSYARRFATTNFRVAMLWQRCDNSKHFRNIVIRLKIVVVNHPVQYRL